MLADTHCHLNMMVKTKFDIPLRESEIPHAQKMVDEAKKNNVDLIINVGTSFIESKNSIMLARSIENVYATIGIHPNDATENWQTELKELAQLIDDKANKIVGIGETGLDKHYPDYNLQRQVDAFRAQIELALEHKLGLVIHSRDAYDETLRVIEEYAKHDLRAVMHCFSYDQTFADNVVAWGLKLGIGGTVTYPRNEVLRRVVKKVKLENMVLETDAPFLPIQAMRGKQNAPEYIKNIAEYIADLRSQSFDDVAQQTTRQAKLLFGIE